MKPFDGEGATDTGCCLAMETWNVVVTGGASGIGRSIATAFARRSATVFVADRDKRAADEFVSGLLARGLAAVAVGWDVTNEAQTSAAVAEILHRSPGVDVLVNNAGAIDRAALEAEDYMPRLERLLDLNILGMARVTQSLLPALKAGRGRAIVNLASVQSFVGLRPGLSAYVASKGAVAQWTRALAVELAPAGVRVNAVAPGLIETAMTEAVRADPEVSGYLRSRIPMARFGQPDEVADAVLFLASRMARYVTGAVLPIDGGLLAQ